MANEKSLFEDDILDDFEDVFASDELEGFGGGVPANDPFDPADAVEVDPPQKEVTHDSHIFTMPDDERGSRQVPAISINVFYERDETRELVEHCANDRRMGRATIELHKGGIIACIAHMAENPTPNLLIVESLDSPHVVLNQIDTLAELCDEGVQVLVVGKVNDIMLYRQLMSRGVSEYLVPPIQPLQLIESISNLFSDPDAPFVGKQISILGAKGGVGASTIAHNLSWALAESARVSTTLVDLDLSFGTTALDFNQNTTQTIADALLAPDRADDSVIERLLVEVTERLSLFTAPASISSIIDIPDHSYTKVLDSVRRNVPYMVLDLPHAWTGWVQSTLLASDEVIIVCQPELASLRNGKNFIDKLKSQRPNDKPPRLIINMSGMPKRPEIPVKDFSAAIGVEPDIVLSFEPELFGSVANNGQMISETDASSKSALAIDHLASILTGRAVVQPEKTLMQKLLGK